MELGLTSQAANAMLAKRNADRICLIMIDYLQKQAIVQKQFNKLFETSKFNKHNTEYEMIQLIWTCKLMQVYTEFLLQWFSTCIQKLLKKLTPQDRIVKMQSTLFTSFGLLLALMLHKSKPKFKIVKQIDLKIQPSPPLIMLANDNHQKQVMPTPEKKKKPKNKRRVQKIQTQQFTIYPRTILTEEMLQNQLIKKEESIRNKCKHVGRQVDALRNYFMDDFVTVTAYNGSKGAFTLNIQIPGSTYSLLPIHITIPSAYPEILPAIQIQTNNLVPLEKQKLALIIKQHKNMFIQSMVVIMGSSPAEEADIREKIIEKDKEQERERERERDKDLQKSTSLSRTHTYGGQSVTSNNNSNQEYHSEIDPKYLEAYYPYILNLCVSISQELFYKAEQAILSVPEDSPVTGLDPVASGASDFNALLNLNSANPHLQSLVEEILNREDQQENILALHKPMEYNIPKFPNPRGRYLSDYEEIQMIGQGGFGRVYRCRHRIDSNIYAVKKMVINYNDRESFKLLKQVSFLSKLNHPNIVRYHQSWLEDTSSVEQLITDMKITDPDEIKQFNKIWKKYSIEHPSHSDKMIMRDLNSSDIRSQLNSDSEPPSRNGRQQSYIFEDDVIFEDYSNFQGSKNMDDIQFEHESFSKTSLVQNDISRKHSQVYEFPFKILYIVMQYCGAMTLKDFIRMKFNEPTEVKIKLIRGILEGLSYIHSKRIMHRDLKPANIFLIESMNKVKIGDFGLATIGNIQSNPYQAEIEEYTDKTKGVGTTFYRAPEQMHSTHYDEKIDIYALGIILLELFYSFDTLMERSEVLSQVAKTHSLPKDFNKIQHNSQFKQQIQSCISLRPSDRPTVQKLLDTFRNKYFTQLVSLIANPKHFQFYQLMNHIFGIKNETSVIMKQNLYRNYLTYEFIKIYQIHRGVLFVPLSLVPVVDFDVLNGIKMQASRSDKFLLLSERGVVMEYPSNTYVSWIRYAKETLKRNIRNDHRGNFRQDYIETSNQMRRFTFEKVSQFIGGEVKTQFSFKQKYVTAFDITFEKQNNLTPYYLCEMLKISLLMIETMCLTQKYPPLYMSHSLIFKCLALQCNVSVINLHRFLLSITDEKFRSFKNQQKIEYMNNFGLQGNIVKRIIGALQAEFEDENDFIKFFAISAKQNERSKVENALQLKSIIEQIKEEIFSVTESLKIFQFYDRVKWKIQIPQANTLGLFWNVGPVKGFSAIEEYMPGQQLCNLHLETSLNPSQEQAEADVSVWSNGEFLQKDIMEVVAKCWENNVTVKWYDHNFGEKDLSCRYNIIIKKKHQRVYLMLRKNHWSVDRSLQKKISEDKNDKDDKDKQKQSAFILKENFNYEVLKNLNKQNQKKQSYVH